MLSNGLVALSSALLAQYQAFADVNIGRAVIVSGLAATGAHQVFKQLSGGKSETEEKQE